MTAAEFIAEQLALIRETFFAKATPKRFFQERPLLLQAISFPAAHLKKRYSVDDPDFALSRAVLATVIAAIKAHGKKIGRFSVYFLHCVQEHLAHHGEEYYARSKAARGAADSLPDVMRKLRVGDGPAKTSSLPELHDILKSKGGRKKRVAQTQIQLI